MAPTPIVPNGELRLVYSIASLDHQLRMRANINNPSGPAPFLLDEIGGGTVAATAAANQVDTLIGAFYNAATIFGQWTLYLRVGTNYLPLTSFASGAVGSNGGFNQSSGQMTLTFRDALNRLDKLVFLESAFTAPAKYVSGIYGGAGTFISDVLLTTPGHIGSWYQGRGGIPPARVLANVVSLNRKIRRRRGLV